MCRSPPAPAGITRGGGEKLGDRTTTSLPLDVHGVGGEKKHPADDVKRDGAAKKKGAGANGVGTIGNTFRERENRTPSVGARGNYQKVPAAPLTKRREKKNLQRPGIP